MNVALTRFPLPTRRQLSVRSPLACRLPAAIGLEVGTIPIVWPAHRRESAASEAALGERDISK